MYYRYETKHNCPVCNEKALFYTGSLNNTEFFECKNCESEMNIDTIYELKDNYVVFCGFKDPVITYNSKL